MISSSAPIMASLSGRPAMGGRQEEQSSTRRPSVETENKDQEMETAAVTLADGMHFVGTIEDFRLDLDAEESAGGVGAGPQPHRLLLLALAGCTAMDVISILRKKRQQISGLTVTVQGSRAEQHPKVYMRIEVLYRVRGNTVDPQAVERAIELSKTRYCPVIGMLGKVAEVTTRYEIEEEAELRRIR
jgi:putative redox protein